MRLGPCGAECALIAMNAVAVTAPAQSAPPVRPLGRVVSTATEPLASVSQVRALSGGRVIVNDIGGRRVLMFDSTLKVVTVIADTTSATADAYSSRIGGLIAYRADSTLFADPATLSMLVIDPGNGKSFARWRRRNHALCAEPHRRPVRDAGIRHPRPPRPPQPQPTASSWMPSSGRRPTRR